MGCSTEVLNDEGPFGVRLCDDMLNVFCDRVQMVAPRQVNGFFAIQSILCDPTLQAQIKPGDEVIQIIFDQYRQHYITVYLTFEDGEPLLRVYDPLLNEASMKDRFLKETITSSVVRQILDLFGHLDCQEGRSEVFVEHVYDIDPQMDGWSCGYRCIGVILDLLQNRDPSSSLYDIRTIYNLYQWVNQPGEHSWEDIISFPYRSKRCKTGARPGFLCLNEDVFESIRDQEIEEEVRRRELLKRKLIDRIYSHQRALSLNTKDRLKPYAPEQSEFPMMATDSSPSHLQNPLVPYLSTTMQAKYLRRQQAPLFHVQHQYHGLTNSLPTSEEEDEETASQTSQTSQATIDWEKLVRRELDDPVDWDRIENEKKRWEWTKEDQDEDQELQQMLLLQRVNRARLLEYNHRVTTVKQTALWDPRYHLIRKMKMFRSATGMPIRRSSSLVNLNSLPLERPLIYNTQFGLSNSAPNLPTETVQTCLMDSTDSQFSNEQKVRTNEMRLTMKSLQRSPRETRIIDVDFLETTLDNATYERTISFSNISSISTNQSISSIDSSDDQYSSDDEYIKSIH